MDNPRIQTVKLLGGFLGAAILQIPLIACFCFGLFFYFFIKAFILSKGLPQHASFFELKEARLARSFLIISTTLFSLHLLIYLFVPSSSIEALINNAPTTEEVYQSSK